MLSSPYWKNIFKLFLDVRTIPRSRGFFPSVRIFPNKGNFSQVRLILPRRKNFPPTKGIFTSKGNFSQRKGIFPNEKNYSWNIYQIVWKALICIKNEFLLFFVSFNTAIGFNCHFGSRSFFFILFFSFWLHRFSIHSVPFISCMYLPKP